MIRPAGWAIAFLIALAALAPPPGAAAPARAAFQVAAAATAAPRAARPAGVRRVGTPRRTGVRRWASRVAQPVRAGRAARRARAYRTGQAAPRTWAAQRRTGRAAQRRWAGRTPTVAARPWRVRPTPTVWLTPEPMFPLRAGRSAAPQALLPLVFPPRGASPSPLNAARSLSWEPTNKTPASGRPGVGVAPIAKRSAQPIKAISPPRPTYVTRSPTPLPPVRLASQSTSLPSPTRGEGVIRPPASPLPTHLTRSPSPRPATPAPLRVDAAGAQALAQALALPPAALARVAALTQALADAQVAPHADTACRVVAAAEATRAALFDALGPRLAEADEAERQLTRVMLQALAASLPGVAVRLPAGFDAPLTAGVDYGALARALPGHTPGHALLAIAGTLRDPAGPPGYLVPPRVAGQPPCADFARVTGALGRLPTAWHAAPSCLRTRLQATLRDAVVRMGEQAEFCRDERQARIAAREAARLLGRLPAFGGPGTGKRIGHNFRSYGLRFGLAP